MIPIKDDNPTRTFPFVNWALILINVVVFFYQVHLPPHAAKAFLVANATVPMRIPAFLAGYLGFKMAFYPMFTSMFLHGGLEMHPAGEHAVPVCIRGQRGGLLRAASGVSIVLFVLRNRVGVHPCAVQPALFRRLERVERSAG